MKDEQNAGGDLNGKLDEIQLAISASADPQTRAYLEGLLGQIRNAVAKRLEEEATIAEELPSFEFSPPDRPNRQLYQQPKPYHSTVEPAVPEEPAGNGHHADAQQIEDYSNAPLYSEWLAQNLGLRAPFEQYGLYLAGLLGVSAFMRRGAYARYLRSMGGVGQDAAALSSWWGPRHHRWGFPASRFGSMHAARHLRAKGVAALVAYPGAWVLFRKICNC